MKFTAMGPSTTSQKLEDKEKVENKRFVDVTILLRNYSLAATYVRPSKIKISSY